MFLQVDEAGSEALYSVAPLTRSFLLQKKAELSGFGILRERIRAFKRHANISNPRVASIISQVERLIPKRFKFHQPDRIGEAYRIVTDRQLPPLVTQDPLFKSVVGYVCSLDNPPRFIEAREAFEYSISMKHEPDFRFLIAWYNAEKESGAHDKWCITITDLVLQGKRYSESEKIEMLGRKAITIYARGRNRILTDPTDAIRDYQEALILHLRTFRLYFDSGDGRSERSEQYAQNTAFQIFQIIRDGIKPWDIIDRISIIAASKEIYIDPLEKPIQEAFRSVRSSVHHPDIIARMRNRLQVCIDAVNPEERWANLQARSRVKAILQSIDTVYREQGRRVTN